LFGALRTVINVELADAIQAARAATNAQPRDGGSVKPLFVDGQYVLIYCPPPPGVPFILDDVTTRVALALGRQEADGCWRRCWLSPSDG